MDPRKARLHAAALQMGHVEIDHSLAIPASFDLMNDGARHHVTRGQLGHVVILGHKAHHFHVAQIRAFTAQRFGDQEPWRALHIERSGMELNEFHVTDLGAGAKGHGYAIASSDGGIGSLAINLAQAAGGQQHRRGAHAMEFARRTHQLDAANSAILQPKIGNKFEITERDGFQPARFGLQGTADLPPGGIAVCMQHARAAMRAFAGKSQGGTMAVEGGAPLDELLDARRAVFDQSFCRVRIRKSVAGLQSVL